MDKKIPRETIHPGWWDLMRLTRQRTATRRQFLSSAGALGRDHSAGDGRVFVEITDRADAVVAVGHEQWNVSAHVALDEEDGREWLPLVDPLQILGHVRFFARQQRKSTRTQKVLGCMIHRLRTPQTPDKRIGVPRGANKREITKRCAVVFASGLFFPAHFFFGHEQLPGCLRQPLSLRGSPRATRSSFDGFLAAGCAEARRECLGTEGLCVSTAACSLCLIDHGVGARDEAFPAACGTRVERYADARTDRKEVAFDDKRVARHSATWAASSTERTCATTTPNSSPPNRATASVGRTTFCTRSANWRSTSSPEA